MKKERQEKKTQERSSSDTAYCGFSTDQRISIESLNINRQRLNHQKQETRLVGLSIHESAIGRQIASAEIRAKERCPKYDARNIYWMRVDALLQKQDDITDNMGTYTNSLMGENTKKDVDVSEFLNQSLPQKKSHKRRFEEMKEEATINLFENDNDDNDEDDEGLAVKVEQIEKVTAKRDTVSKRSSKRLRKK